jgi:hypothetical protein
MSCQPDRCVARARHHRNLRPVLAQPAGGHGQAAPGLEKGEQRSMVADRNVVGLVACAAGGLRTIRDGFVEPALRQDWRVAVTLTPTASRWLSSDGEELARIEQATGLPVRDSPRLPDEPRPHPELACCVVAPASANTVAKLALGISDNQALATANEAVGDPNVPVIVFPKVSAPHIRHPAWAGHLAALRSVGVHLVYGESVFPIDEPREGSPGGRPLPWAAILELTSQVTSR